MMAVRFRVLMTDRAWPDTEIEREILQAVDAELVEPTATDEATLVQIARDVDAIATNWAKVTPAVIQSCRRCRVIARLGIGLDNISIETATQRGIPVTNCPDYCVSEVSDHALGLLLACARQIAFFHLRTKRGEYDLSAARGLRRLSELTVGMIGFGHIARELLPKLKALGLNVMAHTPSGADHGTGCQMVSLDELLAQSDFVSLHAPLSSATHHLINASRLQQMKPTAYLINTSRGGLIDPVALWDALQSGNLAGAALDVFEPEPPDLSLPLYRDERVIVTPHAAFVSEESIHQLRQQAMKQIVQGLLDERPDNLVNPDCWKNR
ncbi:C-terminal binding protein [Schlesneria paludicola]|uniref:C-terminal binding protein n=1 Tax=Schlesneria paludicola TaxID=360056 RepID=UPI00029A78F0|nr:C-terminal binding protein [Schlesneria paludicola]